MMLSTVPHAFTLSLATKVTNPSARIRLEIAYMCVLNANRIVSKGLDSARFANIKVALVTAPKL